LAAGKCVAYLVAEFHNTSETHVATAFFIDRKHLLTAGHCLYKRNHSLKSVQLIEPGISHIDSTKLAQGNYFRIICEVASNLYNEKGSYENDIALLHTGSFSWPNYLELSTALPPKGATVDIIGYPAELSSAWMRTQGTLRDIDANLATVQKLLPKRTLSISRGTVEGAGTVISYKLSTVPGMSGACVVYKGRAIGILQCCIP
jgi:V8-like Glu-specific endopeptidase